MVMETYAEILNKRKEQKMSNYDMDELRRQGKVPDLEKRREFAKDIIEHEKRSVKIGKNETPHLAIDIELPDDIFKKLALQAHEKDITFNKLAINILKKGLLDSEYRFEHDDKPQLLTEKY